MSEKITNKMLLEAAKNWKPTEEDMKELRERLAESKKRSMREPKLEWYNKPFSSL